MIPPTTTSAALPSRGALRALRRLALAGTTVGAIGSVCTAATFSYEVNRRIQFAENLAESKRSLKTTCPNYDPKARGAVVAKMMEAAEAGEFLGMDSIRDKEVNEKDYDAFNEKMSIGSSQSVIPENEVNSVNKKREEALAWMQSLHDPRNFQRSNFPSEPRPVGKNTDDSSFTTLLAEIQSKDGPKGNHAGVLPSYRLRYRDSEAESAALAERFLAQGKPIEAAQRFLRAYPTSSPSIPEDAKQLCVKLFNRNLETGNVHLAHRLFRWMDYASLVSREAWEALIRSLTDKWNLELIATLYTDYEDQFQLSKALRYPVLRSLTDSFRLEEAQKMVFKYLKDDHKCSLCALYLGRLWKKTRNAELVESEFNTVLKAFNDNKMSVTHVIFSSLLEAFVESGMEENAEELVERMQSQYKLPLPSRALGLLAYGRALKSDWDGVERYFEAIHNSEEHPSAIWFSKIFDRVFLEYFLGNPGPNIRNFVFRAIEKYNLIPDEVLFEHIIQAYIQKGSPKMIAELVEAAEKGAWPVTLRQGRLADLLREQRRHCGKSNSGLWQMFRRFGQFSTSQRIMGYHKNDFSTSGHLKPSQTPDLAMLSDTNQQLKGLHHFPPLYQQMIHQIHVGSMDKAMELFNETKMLGKYIRVLDLDLALTASIIHYGSLEQAKTILTEERNSFPWIDKSSMPAFFQKLLSTNGASEADALTMAILNFYQILQRQTLPIKHHVTVSACSNLIRRGRARAALRLIKAINRSKFAGTAPFDPVAALMIAKASSIVGNLAGVRWAILTALHRDSALSKDLVVEVYRAIEILKSRAPDPPDSATPAYEQEIEYLESLAKVLGEKEQSIAKCSPRLARPAFGPKARIGEEEVAKFSEFVMPDIIDTNGVSLTHTLKDWLERVQLEYALTSPQIPFAR